MQTILVVDDDAAILDVVKAILELGGYRVITTQRGEDIWALMDQESPDLILLDIMLAQLDGRKICKSIKSLTAFEQLPIILYSASDVLAADMAIWGANDFVSKPFDMDELLGTIAQHLVVTDHL